MENKKDDTEAQQSIPDALRNFDKLPDAAMVRQPVVEALYGCSSASIWRYVKSGKIPQPHRLFQRITTWNVGELRRALAAGGVNAAA